MPTSYSVCVACGKSLMFTPITKRWVHIGGDAGISHYPTAKSEDAVEFRDWLDAAFPDSVAEVRASVEVTD